MTITYQISIESDNWSDGDIIAESTDYDAILKQYHEYLGECLMDSVIDNNPVDYVCIEYWSDPDDDNPTVAVEYIFNEPDRTTEEVSQGH